MFVDQIDNLKYADTEERFMYSLDEVRKVDPQIADAIVEEQERQNSHIELIASENWVSKAVMDQQVRGRISRKEILWWLRVRGCGGESCH